jgi:hypothetical protein
LLWAFRNAGKRVATVNQLLRIGFSYLRISDSKDLRKIQRELAEMQDEAEHNGDQEQIEFVKGIKESQTLSGLL